MVNCCNQELRVLGLAKSIYYIFSSKFANRWSAEPSTGALTLSSLQLEDFGLFQCLVENKVSEHYVVSLLVVTGMSQNSVIFRSLLKEMQNSTCVFTKQRLVQTKSTHCILTNQIVIKVFFLLSQSFAGPNRTTSSALSASYKVLLYRSV